MSRTNRNRDSFSIRNVGIREKIRTYREKRDLIRLRQQCEEEGLSLSEHQRNPPSAWDDIPVSSLREGKPYRDKPSWWPPFNPRFKSK